MIATVYRWFDRTILELGREMRLSYLPPLMVYLAAGVQGLTGIVGTFFVKDYLGLSAEFLAALGFWAGIPWALKMPLGHLVDLLWRYKSVLIYLGAGLITASLLVMTGLIADPDTMRAVMPAGAWFTLAALLAPIGYVMQDTVADAMTVEAVPRVDAHGQPIALATRRLMNTTMQTLGRVAIIGGGVLVALVNVIVFQDTEALPQAAKIAIYVRVYELALVIPVISVTGVALAALLRRRDATRLRAKGFDAAAVRAMLEPDNEPIRPNRVLLGGSLLFVIVTISVGLSDLTWNEEIIFAGSFTIVVFLIYQLVRELDAEARRTLLGTIIVIFVFRALPGSGAGTTWWMIDELGFDQAFIAKLSFIASTLTLLGLFIFRRFMAERSIAYIVGFLTVVGFLLGLPSIGMYYGLHEWTAALTGGLVDARFIALIDTALESPLGQVSMVPMLAWIANSAPPHLKATYFAVMASFTNLALAASQLGTKHLNQVFTVTREVRDTATGAVQIPADYSEVGVLLITVSTLALLLPFCAIALTRALGLRSA
ncbi:MAG: hypothetical protein IT495_07665 [Gammaproteobacteria bacterium]|nr:hypothetical protein [Gammaproteobacteria bacterium]